MTDKIKTVTVEFLIYHGDTVERLLFLSNCTYTRNNDTFKFRINFSKDPWSIPIIEFVIVENECYNNEGLLGSSIGQISDRNIDKQGRDHFNTC